MDRGEANAGSKGAKQLTQIDQGPDRTQTILGKSRGGK
jgi:hypothetical protein